MLQKVFSDTGFYDFLNECFNGSMLQASLQGHWLDKSHYKYVLSYMNPILSILSAQSKEKRS